MTVCSHIALTWRPKMERFMSTSRIVVSVSALLTAVLLHPGCSGGEEVGTCFFRCDLESEGIVLYGCKPSTRPDDECQGVAAEYCLTLGMAVARHQFVADCLVDCQSTTSCTSCAPSWHGKMCVDEPDGGDASSDGSFDAAQEAALEASPEAAQEAAADAELGDGNADDG